MDYFDFLQNWYKDNCNGYWEHYYGIEIGTLDNPGWYVKIDLKETNYSDRTINLKQDNGENDWITCYVEDKVFYGYGDFNKLKAIITEFIKFVK